MREAGFEPAHPEIVGESIYPRMGLYYINNKIDMIFFVLYL